MKLIVGLGNPGDLYSQTRHNIGRRLLEYIAAREGVKFTSKKSYRSAIALVSWEGEAVLLAHPLTYMNLSGEAVLALLQYKKIDVARDLLIVVDDIALPFGKFRLRTEGSSGGHNGLASIEERLGGRRYSRLRIGIGGLEPGKTYDPLRDYVLSAFDPDEEKKMKALLESGLEACRAWVLELPAKAMNRINGSGA